MDTELYMTLILNAVINNLPGEVIIKTFEMALADIKKAYAEAKTTKTIN